MKKKFRITVDIVYLANGTEDDELRYVLGNLVQNAVGNGKLTDDLPAEVDAWGFQIEKID